MHLQTFRYDTFRQHARMFLEPAVIHKWQKKRIQQLQQRGKVALGGDMQAYSPGHSAKYGGYTLMHLESNTLLDLQPIQSNEVGGSYHMEKEGLKRCLDLLESSGLAVEYIVTDRHAQIQKFLRGNAVSHSSMRCGSLRKVCPLNKDCEVLKKWLLGIQNHIYWTAISSTSGPEKVAKWTSLVNHIPNIHEPEDPLFSKCAHPDRVSRDQKKWFKPGSVSLNRVEKTLNNKRVLKDVEKLSHHHQTYWRRSTT